MYPIDRRVKSSYIYDERVCFFRQEYVCEKGRYSVFSSHVVTATQALRDYMDGDTPSNRYILAPQLPLVPSLEIAQQKLNWETLSIRQLIYYGYIPGLLCDARDVRVSGSLADKARTYFQECVKQKLINDKSIKCLLSTFITGDSDSVPPPLLLLMDTFGRDLKFVVKWIPFHMAAALKYFSSQGECSPSVVSLLFNISTLFDRFMNAKGSSGDVWEALFVLTILIRCLSGEFDECLLPFPAAANLTVTYNELLNFNICQYGDMKTLSQLRQMIPKPHSGITNHIIVYYPYHVQFERYDVIVAFYDKYGTRMLYGYQLKEGRAVADKKPDREMTKCIVVRGNAADQARIINNWHVASEKEINTFFGVSGQSWTHSARKKWR